MTIMPVVGRVGQYVQETRILSDVMERYPVSSVGALSSMYFDFCQFVSIFDFQLMLLKILA